MFLKVSDWIWNKRGSVIFITDQENEVFKIFIIWVQKEGKVFNSNKLLISAGRVAEVTNYNARTNWEKQ